MQVRFQGTIGPQDADQRLLILYTGGTVGMVAGPDGALAPLDFRDLPQYLPALKNLPIRLTLAAFEEPIDSAAALPAHWLAIADAIVDGAADHTGVVVLHGTDTMAYTASALSFLLTGIDLPVVLTGSQRPITSVRSDGRENIVTAAAIAAMRAGERATVPEVTIFFGDLLLRGNRATKVHAERYHAFDSPNLPPLGRAGVTIELDHLAIRAPGTPPVLRSGGVCSDVASLRLHPGLDEATLASVLGRPHLRGLVIEAFGAGNGPTEAWFLDALRAACDAGVVVVVVTQCGGGTVLAGAYATGVALFETGAVPGYDLTFEAALTKLMVLLHGRSVDEVRALMQQDLAGELTR